MATDLLAGKNILVTGVLTDASIAFHIARLAQEQGARVILSSYGRVLSLTTRIAGRLPHPAPVIELDVTNNDDLAALPTRIKEHAPHLDGVVHSIGFAPESALGGNFLNTEWSDVATALQISAYSLKSLTMAARPLFTPQGASIVGLDFDATVAWPKYDWMGVENVRVNLVAAGPIRTMAAKSIPGFSDFESVWNERAPLHWDVTDPVPAAQATVALLSDWFPKTTAEIIHVDGGLHGMGA
jgi:enoyl-[acyl-carrier protein] reductase I